MSGSEGGTGESMHILSWFARRQYWLLIWAIASGIVAAALEALGGLGQLFIYPMCVMPVVLLAASRVVSFVRNYYLEYDEADDEDKPYLAFFLQTAGVGIILAAVIYLCGQLVLGAAYPDDVLASAAAGEWMSAAADPDGALNAAIGAARMLSSCFACAAGVTFASCAFSVIYLKLLFWRDEHDLNTSGIALSVSSVLIACVLYAVLSTLAVFLVAA